MRLGRRPSQGARRSAGRSGGQGLVEFALVIPIFLLFMLGLFEGARLVYSNGVLAHAAQQGARLAALASTTDETMVKQRVRDSATGIAVATGDITITVTRPATSPNPTYTSRAPADRVKLVVTHTFRPVL